LTNRHSRTLPTGSVLTGIAQNLLYFILVNAVVVDMWHISFGIDVEADFHRY
jgi:hypothetical protein